MSRRGDPTEGNEDNEEDREHTRLRVFRPAPSPVGFVAEAPAER